jgi:hypothetical protein
MGEHAPTILIFGDQGGLAAGPNGPAQPTPVKLDTVKANLRSAVENVKCMVNAMQGAVDGLSVTYVDIGIVISADGSVGLLGSGSGANTTTTLSVRLQSHQKLQF